MAILTKTFSVKGMHCSHCESVVEQAARQVRGVKQASADYGEETLQVTYDSVRLDVFRLFHAIETKGYQCSLAVRPHPVWEHLKKLAEIVIGLGVLAAILLLAAEIQDRLAVPEFGQSMGYGMIFFVGFLTGFHCIGMCGGFIVGYTTRHSLGGKRSHGLRHIAYGLGKTLSYTALGAGFGLMGGVVTFTPDLRGMAGILAGLFLVMFGLNMLHLLPHWRIFRLGTPPWLARFVYAEYRRHHSPFVIGLLNGLMIACGPLQAMYIMAAGTGSTWEGAGIMLVFGAGTLPLLLGFGFIASLVSSKATHSLLQASGFLVIALGLIMLNRGLLLTGSGYDAQSLAERVSDRLPWLVQATVQPGSEQQGYQIIHMEAVGAGYRPSSFTLRRGVPVRWVITGKEINECNRAIVVPKLGLRFDIQEGEQTIEFTPAETGIIPWSCWMGMLRGEFIVADEVPDDP